MKYFITAIEEGQAKEEEVSYFIWEERAKAMRELKEKIHMLVSAVDNNKPITITITKEDDT